MSSENQSSSTFAETNAVDAKVAGVERQVQALEAALKTSRRSRQTILLGFIALIAIVSWLFYPMLKTLQSKEFITKMSDEAQRYLEDHSEDYIREVQTLSDNVTPVITKAFYEQAKKDTPKFTMAFDRERDVLMKNLERRLQEQVNAHYEKILVDYEAIIVQEFPQADDEIVRRRVVANFREALNRMVKKFYADELRAELQALYDTWDSFPVADPPEEGDVPAEDQLIGYLLELMSVKMSGSEQLVIAEADIAATSAAAAAPGAAPEKPAADAPAKPDAPATPDAPETKNNDGNADPAATPDSSAASESSASDSPSKTE